MCGLALLIFLVVLGGKRLLASSLSIIGSSNSGKTKESCVNRRKEEEEERRFRALLPALPFDAVVLFRRHMVIRYFVVVDNDECGELRE